jgi:hypothetical protein
MANLVVEGFPRSGTTFLHGLLSKGFPDYDVYYSRHAASRLNLENVVAVIRDPYEAIFSWQNHLVKNENIHDIANWYVRYHKELLNNINNITLIDFNEMITDSSLVLKKVSEKFNVDYVPVDVSKLNKDESKETYTPFVTKETKEAYQVYKKLLKHLS